MTTATASSQQSNIWWLFLLHGIAAIILGIAFVTAPGSTLILAITFLGFYWLIGGVLSFVRIFVDRSVPWVWSLLSGIVGILGGLLVLRHPLLAAVTVPTVLVIIIGIEGLILGAVQMIECFKGGGIGSFLLGAVNVVIGLILLGSPVAAGLAVPLVFGILLLIQGVSLILWAFRVRAA